jgi:MOSC domain-containing protein
MEQVGRVEAIWIYPVRSLAGSSVERAELGPAGLIGDRAYTAIGDDGRPLRGKDAPEMRAVTATGEPDADAARLSQALGRPVRLAPSDPPSGEIAPVHLVSTQALTRAAAGEVPQGCSAEDPRANLLLSLPDDDERTWVGRVLQVGSALLEVTRTPKHCLGVYADVRRAGALAVGDPVLL